MATSLILSLIRKLTSSSMLLRLLICVDCTSMLVSGGMINVATVIFGSVDSSSCGRRSFHMGSIFILLVFSSYLMRPWSERYFENLTSLLVWIPSWSVSSSSLCHSPFLMAMKKLSMLILVEYYGQEVLF